MQRANDETENVYVVYRNRMDHVDDNIPGTCGRYSLVGPNLDCLRSGMLEQTMGIFDGTSGRHGYQLTLLDKDDVWTCFLEETFFNPLTAATEPRGRRVCKVWAMSVEFCQTSAVVPTKKFTNVSSSPRISRWGDGERQCCF